MWAKAHLILIPHRVFSLHKPHRTIWLRQKVRLDAAQHPCAPMKLLAHMCVCGDTHSALRRSSHKINFRHTQKAIWMVRGGGLPNFFNANLFSPFTLCTHTHSAAVVRHKVNRERPRHQHPHLAAHIVVYRVERGAARLIITRASVSMCVCVCDSINKLLLLSSAITANWRTWTHTHTYNQPYVHYASLCTVPGVVAGVDEINLNPTKVRLRVFLVYGVMNCVTFICCWFWY